MMNWNMRRDGLYLIQRFAKDKGVIHYAILDQGMRLFQILPQHPYFPARIIHLSPKGFQLEAYDEALGWTIVKKIEDEASAIQRTIEAAKNPDYNLIGNNCEHFARYVADGKRESHQVQLVGVLGAIALLVIAAPAMAAGRR